VGSSKGYFQVLPQVEWVGQFVEWLENEDINLSECPPQEGNSDDDDDDEDDDA